MKKAFYVLCALALVGGMVQGCTQKAAATGQQFGELVGTTQEGVVVRKFHENGSLCLVGEIGPESNASISISCK